MSGKPHQHASKPASNKPATKPSEHAQAERERIEEQEDEVTVQSDDSFPASDPPSWTPVRGPTGEKD